MESNELLTPVGKNNVENNLLNMCSLILGEICFWGFINNSSTFFSTDQDCKEVE